MRYQGWQKHMMWPCEQEWRLGALGTGTFLDPKSSMLCQDEQSLRAWRTQPSGAVARDFRVRPMWSETEAFNKKQTAATKCCKFRHRTCLQFLLKGEKKESFNARCI